ncbi:MAG: ABC transporter permease, partial [Pseudomonadota bacterium]
MEFRPILSALLRNKTGAVLVAIQVALSLAILANALHIVHVRQEVAARPSGIADESSVFYIDVRNLLTAGFEEQLAMQKREAAALRAVSGVASVALVSQMPLTRSGSTNSVAVDRKQLNETADASYYITADSLVDTLGLKIVEGRDFSAADVKEVDYTNSKSEPQTVIITRALAEKMYPGVASVVGKTMFFGTGDDATASRIIGVVERLQTQGAAVGLEGEYSTIVAVRGAGTVPRASFAVRTEPGQLERVVKEAEAALHASSTAPMITRVRLMTEERTERYRADVALSWMLITVSILLLLITASGIVGMASLWVQQR